LAGTDGAVVSGGLGVYGEQPEPEYPGVPHMVSNMGKIKMKAETSHLWVTFRVICPPAWFFRESLLFNKKTERKKSVYSASEIKIRRRQNTVSLYACIKTPINDEVNSLMRVFFDHCIKLQKGQMNKMKIK
jgi:hypothetical protein